MEFFKISLLCFFFVKNVLKTFYLKLRGSDSEMVFNNVQNYNSLNSITKLLIIAAGDFDYCSTFLFMSDK